MIVTVHSFRRRKMQLHESLGVLAFRDGLLSEKEHMQVELKETRDLMKGYEKKTGTLIVELSDITKEY